MPAAPSPRRFAAGALATIVAVFGVLALRVHDGDDPGLAATAPSTKAVTTASDPSSASSASSDSTTSSDDSGAVSSTPSASTSAS